MGQISNMFTNVFNTFGDNWFLGLLYLIVVVVGLMKIFSKAGENPILAIVPIVNLYILAKITCNNGLWFLILFLPVIGQLAYCIMLCNLARKFNKDIIWMIGLIFFTPIFICILGFGDSTYYG